MDRLEKHAGLSFRFPHINIFNPLHCSNRFNPTFAPDAFKKGGQASCRIFQPPANLCNHLSQHTDPLTGIILPGPPSSCHAFSPLTFQQSLSIYFRANGCRKLNLLVPTAVTHSSTRSLFTGRNTGIRTRSEFVWRMYFVMQAASHLLAIIRSALERCQRLLFLLYRSR